MSAERYRGNNPDDTHMIHTTSTPTPRRMSPLAYVYRQPLEPQYRSLTIDPARVLHRISRDSTQHYRIPIYSQWGRGQEAPSHKIDREVLDSTRARYQEERSTHTGGGIGW